MDTIVSQFHFLRPWWLLALIPALILCILLWQQKKYRSAWQGLIDANLLKYLLDSQISSSFRWQLMAVLIAWIIAGVGLAGPSWERLPQPVHQPEAAVVVLLDLSPSMMAEDIKPSRLVRTRYKVTDYLKARAEGVTALIAYAGEAYTVSPLTDDINTITNLLPALEPAIMPLAGSNIEMAVDMALKMFADAGIARGEILTVTDGIDPSAFADIKQKLTGLSVRFSILGIGSTDGAPIPTGNGGFAKDSERNIVVAKLNRNELQRLSADLGGVYVDLRADESDVETLLNSTQQLNPDDQQRVLEREFDTWLDQGQWLALLLLPFIALAFRKGWLLSIVFISLLKPEPSLAFEWQDLWLRSDQQGQRSLAAGDPATAAQQFISPDWQGTANYRAQNYDAAADAFAQGDSALDHFNHGNALAKVGQLEQALEAYDQAMDLANGASAEHEDAEFNAELVKKLLQQQKQQENQQGDQNDEQDNQQNQDNEQQNQQADNSQQQDGDQQSQQNQDQQSQNQQSQQQAQQNGNQQKNGEQNQSQQNNVDEEAAQQLAAREQQGEDLTEAEQQQLQQWREQNLSEQSKSERNKSEQNSSEESTDPNGQLLAERGQQTEEEQALEQWLRQVPDDPSGLMRRKFEYQHRKMLQDYRSGRWEPPENGAYERW